MKTLALLFALIALPALAVEPLVVQSPTDAPTIAATDAKAPTVTTIAPSDSILCFDGEQRANIVKAYEFQKTRADTLEASIPSKALVVTLIVSGVVLGAAVGAGITYVAMTPPKTQ